MTASTSGIDKVTTVPVRKPRLRNDTASTIAIASPSEETKSLIDCWTISGWSATTMDVDARRQIGLQAFHFCLKTLTQTDDIAAFVHCHRDTDRILALHAHARGRRVDETAANGRYRRGDKFDRWRQSVSR